MKNVIVDALSRRVHGEFNIIIIMVPVWHKEIKEIYEIILLYITPSFIR